MKRRETLLTVIMIVANQNVARFGCAAILLVLYATPTCISLKYAREDNVANGYTVHIENVCVDPQLLALYQSLDAAGRRWLPGIHNGQSFGRAAGARILVGIQDSGARMDPRARKDWWHER